MGCETAGEALAQAFQDNATGGVFVVDVNHLKSKGSACDAPDAGDGQANCAIVRTNSANLLLAEWLATDPTGSGSDPIEALENHGCINLISHFQGPEAYSYVFDGQWGYLDHALGSPGALSHVTGVADWHINAYEPAILDYNTDFKTPGQVVSLYAPDKFRVSDHDIVVVGLDLTLPPPTPAAIKQQVIAALRVMLPSGDTKTDKRITKAIEWLEKSLNPGWWIDDEFLSLADGSKVFGAEKAVVK
ncbi:hypothetical protein BH23CHL7_BH23CHL7_09980 [soil metagenome]